MSTIHLGNCPLSIDRPARLLCTLSWFIWWACSETGFAPEKVVPECFITRRMFEAMANDDLLWCGDKEVHSPTNCMSCIAHKLAQTEGTASYHDIEDYLLSALHYTEGLKSGQKPTQASQE
jgi:hypothetical protein